MAKPKTPGAKPKAAPKPKTPAKAKAPARPKLAIPKPKAKPAAEDRLEVLAGAVQAVREGRRASPRTARLIAAGAPKMAQKVVEEAAEVAIEAVLGRRDPLINDSVDLLYNLAVLWNEAGIRLEDLWTEMDRRQAAFGMSEKLPKSDDI